MAAEKTQRFQSMVESNPDNELARYSLGSSLMDDNEFGEAEKHLERAIELKGDWIMAYILRARCLVHLQRYPEAKELLLQGRQHSLGQGHEGPVEEIDELLSDLPD